jgi:cyclophilin family peptidyl-prolyl cis-trans isomerase
MINAVRTSPSISFNAFCLPRAGWQKWIASCVWKGFLISSVGTLIAAPKLLPVLNHSIADQSVTVGSSSILLSMANSFGMEAIDDQVVRFTSQFNNSGAPIVMDMALFSNRSPITRTNFLKYVADGDYVNSFIHRSVSNFVIQGGASRVVNNAFAAVPTDPPISNEFGVSNTLGTISMAKAGYSPNSATSQWFVSLGANSDNLDNQNGGFTVFGRLTRSTLSSAQLFGNTSYFPTFDYGGIYNELPLFDTHVVNNIQFGELILFTNVSLVALPLNQAGESAVLTYSILSNSNPTVATAAIQSSALVLTPVNLQVGVAYITVRATDSVGNTVDDTFSYSIINDTFTTWVTKNTFPNGQNESSQNPDNDEWNNLQEFAFIGNPGVVNSQASVIFQGVSGTAPAARYITLTFPVRKFTQGLTYTVEANDALSGTWTEIWKSSDGFSHSQVVTALNQLDRTVLTVKDTAAVTSKQKRFMRIKVTQQ